MPEFKLKKDCLGRQAGEMVGISYQRAALLMRTGYIEEDNEVMKKVSDQVKKAKAKETANSKKAKGREKAVK